MNRSTANAPDANAARVLRTDEAPRTRRLAETAATWPGVHLAPHRFDAIAFQLGGKEFGHVHRSGVLDIPFPKAIRDALIAEGRAATHRWVPDSGWISFRVRTGADAEHALWLLRCSYVYRALQPSRAVFAGEKEAQTAVDQLALSETLRARYDTALRRRHRTAPKKPAGFDRLKSVTNPPSS